MPKVRLGRSAGSGSSRRRPPPEGWELIEPTLEELEGKMREAETESHEGKRKVIQRHSNLMDTRDPNPIDQIDPIYLRDHKRSKTFRSSKRV